jgi:hypothetical protein
MRARALLTVLVALSTWWLPSSAWASQTVRLSTSFNPDRLGADTTIMVDFTIRVPRGELPSPLVDIGLRLPAGIISDSNTLGLATCDPGTLIELGLGGCSPNALMGRGSALVGVPLGPSILLEPVDITILMGPPANGHTVMLFYAQGASPVIARLVFPGALLGDSGPFGARLNTTIPLIPGLPGAPDVALVSMRSSIGPKGLTYYKRVHGTAVAYVPNGFVVPASCPAGGFPFAASFTFEDGTSASTNSVAPCPRAGGRIHHSRS